MPTVKAHVANYGVQAYAAVAAMGLGQVAVALAVVASVTALTITDKLDGAAAVGVLSAIIGYVFGRTTTNVANNPPEG